MGCLPSALEAAFAPITIIAGHYGAGKTNLSVNLALDLVRDRRAVTLVDLDIVNPYFRASEQRGLLEQAGVHLVAPVFSEAGTSLDVPSLTGAIIPALEDADGEHLVIVDLGGDDVGATALGQLHRQIETAGYEMLYVVNRYRVLSTKPEETLPLLREIETASHLKATAIVNNSNLAVQTDMQTVLDAVPFAKKAAELCHLPLLYSTVPDFAVENTLPEGFKAVKRYVRFVWEDETE